jgi:glycosyltransferase involved in cell wall biosynthesis
VDKKVLLYLGLIKPYKGILELMEAFNKIENNEDMLLLIAGKSMDEDYFIEINNKLQTNISIREGFISDEDLQIYFNATDLVVLPFEKIENSGSVILAMGFGKAIVAPSKGVLAKRLHSQLELLYTSKNIQVDDLKRINKYSLSDLESFGNNNKENLSRYTWGDYRQAFY